MTYTRDCDAMRRTKKPILLHVDLPPTRRRAARDSAEPVKREDIVAMMGTSAERMDKYDRKVAPLVAAHAERDNRSSARDRAIAHTKAHDERVANFRAIIDASKKRTWGAR